MSKTKVFDQFVNRHLGVNAADLEKMVSVIGVNSLDQLIEETVPDNIRNRNGLNLPAAQTEAEYLKELKELSMGNQVFRTYIGQGYYGTITPSVILRSVFQNPGWYTQYTPYQAEIAQGRLESLLNYQTMVADLTGLPIANASLLDEGTAAAEAMTMFYDQKNKRNKKNPARVFLVADTVFEQTLDILYTRALPLDIEVRVMPVTDFVLDESVFGILLQYPDRTGSVEDHRALAKACNEQEIYVTVAADLLAMTMLTPPGEWGADCVVGNTQRFGVPMGFGGPHAAYFATKEDFKRQIPGRIIGVSVDRHGNKALRMALQTREQHIRRDKATSNICTAQALLANIAAFYGVYHGPTGLKAIAQRVHAFAQILDREISGIGFTQTNAYYFDTLRFQMSYEESVALREMAEAKSINFWYTEGGVQISIDETTTLNDIGDVFSVFAELAACKGALNTMEREVPTLPEGLMRTSPFLTAEVFNIHRTETQMMRYIKRLENKDLSLVHSMIPLGSCTMKLNAATQLIPVSWRHFADIHPFVPQTQVGGYLKMFAELEAALCEITGFDACSLQPNSGAQGEYAGLLTIRAYHLANGDTHRNIALIPDSAHGTNPASAVMAGMKVVVVKCDNHGNIDVADLKAKIEKHAANLSALMVTYPSTHGVFETAIKEICDLVHQAGGKVYMDGANMNAQVGLTSPGLIGADVCHLNLHKTFAIPHGGGGPGMGPICVNKSLAPFLPKHVYMKTGGDQGISAVSAAPYGSASILLISYGYIKMLGAKGLQNSTEIAILNANYIKERLAADYSVLFTGEKGRAAHELILDLRPFKAHVSAEDVAKRLIDYGFHAPTLSFPVAGTIMIEPTESEDLAELDRFCEAMIAIRAEIKELEQGMFSAEDNVLVNAPHPQHEVTADAWTHAYSRKKAAFPIDYLNHGWKFWPEIARVNNAYGDRNLICTCAPISDYMDEAETETAVETPVLAS